MEVLEMGGQSTYRGRPTAFLGLPHGRPVGAVPGPAVRLPRVTLVRLQVAHVAEALLAHGGVLGGGPAFHERLARAHVPRVGVVPQRIRARSSHNYQLLVVVSRGTGSSTAATPHLVCHSFFGLLNLDHVIVLKHTIAVPRRRGGRGGRRGRRRKNGCFKYLRWRFGSTHATHPCVFFFLVVEVGACLANPRNRFFSSRSFRLR
mmetsp:Transcript_43887/g.81143  ORF Transcript_43887/g.81143 Transcript_43887/m.81143 type:complete len:204 (-) Transcript_43887:79-690(-)